MSLDLKRELDKKALVVCKAFNGDEIEMYEPEVTRLVVSEALKQKDDVLEKMAKAHDVDCGRIVDGYEARIEAIRYLFKIFPFIELKDNVDEAQLHQWLEKVRNELGDNKEGE